MVLAFPRQRRNENSSLSHDPVERGQKVVPVIRNAGSLSFAEIEGAIVDYVKTTGKTGWRWPA